MKNKILKENSKRLMRLFYPFNPIVGDSRDEERFLFNVKGIRKVFLPKQMKSIPIIDQLIKIGSISKFIRSNYYKTNFNSVAQVLTILHSERLKYDFPYWIVHNYQGEVNYTDSLTLIRRLQKERWIGKLVRLIIRKNYSQEIKTVLNLFIIWFKAYSKRNLNVMAVSRSKNTAVEQRRFFKKWRKEGKFYSESCSTPDNCRGRDFSILLFSDMGRWYNSNKSKMRRIVSSTFPVILNNKDTAIILESGPCKNDSLFQKELKAAQGGISPFTPIILPWYESKDNIYRFDSNEEKLQFQRDLVKYKNSKIFPIFKKVSGKYLYKLWNKGISLEALHWYATESLYYHTRIRFQRIYPVFF